MMTNEGAVNMINMIFVLISISILPIVNFSNSIGKITRTSGNGPKRTLARNIEPRGNGMK